MGDGIMRAAEKRSCMKDGRSNFTRVPTPILSYLSSWSFGTHGFRVCGEY